MSMEAMPSLKRRLSDVAYRQMVDDTIGTVATGPGGHRGTSTNSSVTSSHPHAGSSEKSLPGPVGIQPKPPSPPRLNTEGSHVRTFECAPPRMPVGGQALLASMPCLGVTSGLECVHSGMSR